MAKKLDWKKGFRCVCGKKYHRDRSAAKCFDPTFEKFPWYFGEAFSEVVPGYYPTTSQEIEFVLTTMPTPKLRKDGRIDGRYRRQRHLKGRTWSPAATFCLHLRRLYRIN